MLQQLRQRARRLKADVVALYHAARHPDTPWLAKLLVAAVVAYACSPIDLIPDFIPVLGLLDDLVLLPLGIALAIRMIPPAVLKECRNKAAGAAGRPVSLAGAIAIAALWLAAFVLVAWWAWRYMEER